MLSRMLMYYQIGGLGAAVKALLGKLFGVQFTVKVQPDGVRYPITLRIPSSDVPVYIEVFQLKEYEFPEPIAPAVILDAGANVGLSAVYFANLYPAARILAIEPELENYNCLVQQVAPYPNISALHCALWSHNEDIFLHDPGRGRWGFETSANKLGRVDGAESRRMVRGRTVDSILMEYSLTECDLLKIDIEGSEAEVFGACGKWIAKVKYIIAELHEGRKRGCTAAYSHATQLFEKHWKHGGHVYAARK